MTLAVGISRPQRVMGSERVGWVTVGANGHPRATANRSTQPCRRASIARLCVDVDHRQSRFGREAIPISSGACAHPSGPARIADHGAYGVSTSLPD